ncbi:E3 ubiquitin-protein ligase PUB23 [Senna tora]|uniref:E3 ubiquitin-protein ligase PUB23 n=1 Tax=Senna tora TaxID=362788 RepID=A0A834SIL1_9FABA|nr:E3 ubiquitin-protein ligase PUB23 [Senna tora]
MIKQQQIGGVLSSDTASPPLPPPPSPAPHSPTPSIYSAESSPLSHSPSSILSESSSTPQLSLPRASPAPPFPPRIRTSSPAPPSSSRTPSSPYTPAEAPPPPKRPLLSPPCSCSSPNRTIGLASAASPSSPAARSDLSRFVPIPRTILVRGHESFQGGVGHVEVVEEASVGFAVGGDGFEGSEGLELGERGLGGVFDEFGYLGFGDGRLGGGDPLNAVRSIHGTPALNQAAKGVVGGEIIGGVIPVETVTGSFMISKEMGQTKKGGTSISIS